MTFDRNTFTKTQNMPLRPEENNSLMQYDQRVKYEASTALWKMVDDRMKHNDHVNR